MRELVDGFSLGQGNVAVHGALCFFKFLCNLTFKGHFSGKGKKSTETVPKTETDTRTRVTRNRTQIKCVISWEGVVRGPWYVGAKPLIMLCP